MTKLLRSHFYRKEIGLGSRLSAELDYEYEKPLRDPKRRNQANLSSRGKATDLERWNFLEEALVLVVRPGDQDPRKGSKRAP